jgi:hypothetical protein
LPSWNQASKSISGDTDIRHAVAEHEGGWYLTLHPTQVKEARTSFVQQMESTLPCEDLPWQKGYCVNEPSLGTLPCEDLPWQKGYSETDPSSGPEAQVSGVSKDWPGAENFEKVQMILDQNRLLIKEINQNHSSRQTEGLSRNVELIRALHKNVAMVRTSVLCCRRSDCGSRYM